jgi:hypothetical protein
MLTIEFGDPKFSVCECCGGRTTSLTRFVYKDENAHAIYYATFSDTHPAGFVNAVVSLGEWGEGSDASARLAVALQIRVGTKNSEVMVTGPDECPWRDAKIIGRILSREEALNHPWISEVFHISDHIVAEDEPVKRYLGGLAG